MTNIYKGDTPEHADDLRDDAQFIVLLQIRDILYAQYAKIDAPAAKKLIDFHHEGGIIGPDVHFDPSKSLDNGDDSEVE